VEIDSTFYGAPPAGTVANWQGETPAHFRFTCKAPKRITHELRLRECEGEMEAFLERMRPLHGHLGAVLVQLPPSFAPGRDGTALREFLRGLPHGWRFAIEFRHGDWHQPRFVKMLEDHGVAWVWSDMTPVSEQQQGPFGFLPETADFLYVRLMGDLRTKYGPGGRRNFQYRKVLWKRTAAIEGWAARIRKQAEEVKNVYVLCSNHYEGFAPATCRELGARLGLEFTLPGEGEAEPEEKGQLKLL
jgi:uncharacterized protein YecE (DUF72 family)